jgi:hypothetical protein
LLFELENQEKEIEYKETGVLQLTFNIWKNQHMVALAKVREQN